MPSELRNARQHYVGKRIRLVACNDEWTKLEPGALGTVTGVDDLGTIQVEWDSGSTLGLIPEAGDRFEVVTCST